MDCRQSSTRATLTSLWWHRIISIRSQKVQWNMVCQNHSHSSAPNSTKHTKEISLMLYAVLISSEPRYLRVEYWPFTVRIFEMFLRQCVYNVSCSSLDVSFGLNKRLVSTIRPKMDFSAALQYIIVFVFWQGFLLTQSVWRTARIKSTGSKPDHVTAAIDQQRKQRQS